MTFRRVDDVDGIPVHRFGLHPITAPNRELCETENPLVGEVYRDLLDREAFDLVHVFHPRTWGEAAIAGPAERGIPVVVNSWTSGSCAPTSSAPARWEPL